jgi:glycosyltransferase involved in cell wall biosynthesis
MRLVAASRVLNESDIIEPFVRHTAHFVDHHIFVDNGSTDGTLRILQSLHAEGIPLTVYQSRARSFVETRINTFLYQTAVSQHQADWVMHLDVDEFIDDRALVEPLRECITRFGARHGDGTCMAVPLREYHMKPEDPEDLIVSRRITHCSPVSDNTKVIVPASLARRQAVVQAGNHGVVLDGIVPCPMVQETTLTYAHFATRSAYQWMSKSIIGWAKVLASGSDAIKSGVSYHYKAPFEALRDNPAAIFKDPVMMQNPASSPDLSASPIEYRGGPLRYTASTDYAMRALQVTLRYLEEVATQHGDLLKAANDMAALVNRTEGGVTRVI